MRVYNIYTVNITFVVSVSAGVLTNTSLGKHWNKGRVQQAVAQSWHGQDGGPGGAH